MTGIEMEGNKIICGKPLTITLWFTLMSFKCQKKMKRLMSALSVKIWRVSVSHKTTYYAARDQTEPGRLTETKKEKKLWMETSMYIRLEKCVFMLAYMCGCCLSAAMTSLASSPPATESCLGGRTSSMSTRWDMTRGWLVASRRSCLMKTSRLEFRWSGCFSLQALQRLRKLYNPCKRLDDLFENEVIKIQVIKMAALKVKKAKEGILQTESLVHE